MKKILYMVVCLVLVAPLCGVTIDLGAKVGYQMYNGSDSMKDTYGGGIVLLSLPGDRDYGWAGHWRGV